MPENDNQAGDLVTTPEELDRLCATLAASEYVAIDTEFVRERTYSPRLCLIQIASGATLACIDALALDDLTPLVTLLQTPTITKVLHAARQDLEIFLQLHECVPAPVFDTQLAADLCGLGNQAGLASVAEQLLGVEIDKQHARADWSKRPLRPALLRYALDDVRYLVPIFERLRTRLDALGRSDWLEEDCRRLLDPDLYRVEPDSAWRRVGGIGRLDGSRFHAACLLAEWRERRARQLDRPRGWVLRDDALVALAHAMPGSAQALDRVRDLPPALKRKAGPDLLATIARAHDIDEEVPERPQPLTADQKRRVTAALELVRETAEQLQISSATLATRREVTRIVRGSSTSVVLEGWRREIIGERLLEFSGAA